MAGGAPEDGFRITDLIRTAAVARRYYIDGVSKVDIADEFGLSRFQVARILDKARESGVVRIDIAVPGGIDAALSDAVRAAYGLHQAIVVTAEGPSGDSVRAPLASAAASYLTEVVGEGDVLGFACSRTLNAVTRSLTDLPRCTVIQLTGALSGVSVEDNSVEVVRRLASLSGGPAHPIYAPLVVSDATTAELLRQQAQVRDVIGRYSEITKAMVAVGSWDPPDSQVRAAMTEAEAVALRQLGVRAEVCARLLDDEGQPVINEFSDRVIAITTEQLRQIPEVIAVAGGISKANAIRAVLLGGLATSLVTDAAVARSLLERVPDGGKTTRGVGSS
jgi:DNA-binding transcriptional regulator LsrR (DeoR family)